MKKFICILLFLAAAEANAAFKAESYALSENPQLDHFEPIMAASSATNDLVWGQTYTNRGAVASLTLGAEGHGLYLMGTYSLGINNSSVDRSVEAEDGVFKAESRQMVEGGYRKVFANDLMITPFFRHDAYLGKDGITGIKANSNDDFILGIRFEKMLTDRAGVFGSYENAVQANNDRERDWYAELGYTYDFIENTTSGVMQGVRRWTLDGKVLPAGTSAFTHWHITNFATLGVVGQYGGKYPDGAKYPAHGMVTFTFKFF